MAEQKRDPNQKNPFRLWIAIGLLFFGLFAVINGVTSLLDNRTRLLAPDGIIEIEVVDTPELRQQGLSGRSSLPENEGMLFDFDDTATANCFWMKDMQFSLDMVWLDEDKNVITVISDVSPDTFPESFCPTSPAKYGLEINAGRASELGITDDVTLRF